MEIFLMYLKVFAVGGALCALGQLLINKTKMSSARILVCFMLLGALLEITGAFGYMKEFAGAGVTVQQEESLGNKLNQGMRTMNRMLNNMNWYMNVSSQTED